jgi:hypothetical protein
LPEIAQLVSFKEETLDALAYKQLPERGKEIGTVLHTHAHEWLSYISHILKKIPARKSKALKKTNKLHENPFTH